MNFNIIFSFEFRNLEFNPKHMIINYKELLLKAADIVWRNKFLWFFGIFAAILSGSGSYWNASKEEAGVFLSIFSGEKMSAIFSGEISILILVFVGFFIILAVAVFIFWLAVVSQGALIKSTVKIYNGQESDFQEAIKFGVKSFWPVLLYKIIERIIWFLLIAISLLPVFLTWSRGEDFVLVGLFYLISFLIMVLMFGIFFWIRYSMSYNLIKGISFGESFSAGFNLLKRNVLISIETVMFVFLATFIVGFLVVLAVLALAIPFVFLIFLLKQMGWTVGLLFILIVGFTFLFLAIILAGGILSAFGDAVWTILFIKLIKDKPRSAIGNLFKK